LRRERGINAGRTLTSVHIFKSTNHSGDEIIKNGSNVIEIYDGTREDGIELEKDVSREKGSYCMI